MEVVVIFVWTLGKSSGGVSSTVTAHKGTLSAGTDRLRNNSYFLPEVPLTVSQLLGQVTVLFFDTQL